MKIRIMRVQRSTEASYLEVQAGHFIRNGIIEKVKPTRVMIPPASWMSQTFSWWPWGRITTVKI